MAQPSRVQDLSVSALQARIARLERLLGGTGWSQQLYRQLTALQQDLEAIRGTVEQNQHTLQLLEQRQQQLERVLAALAPAAAKSKEVGEAPKIQKAGSDRDAYNDVAALLKKSPSEAQRRFEKFLKDYPQSSYAPNAHYWLGQLLFNQGRKNDAANHFAVVVRDFPQSAKRGDAMLKIGLITQARGDLDKAKAIYRRVMQQHTHSPAAERAKAQLMKLQ